MTNAIPSLPRRAELQPGQSPDNVNGNDPPADNGRGANVEAAAALLDGMGVRELLDLRSRVDAKLPARDLKDIDLERELVLQLMATQELQREVLQREDTPANQLAQVSNAVQAALTNLVKMQGEVYRSERLKRIESALVDTLKAHLPHDAQVTFFAAYERATEGQ